MSDEQPAPMDSFESWLLRRVAQAGEVSADLMADLRAEFEASREKPAEQSHADATQDIAIELQMPVAKVEVAPAALEVRPWVIWEVFVRLNGKRVPQIRWQKFQECDRD